MKTTILALLIIVMFPIVSFAEIDYSIEDVKVILYKSGEVTRGIIVDSIPGQSIRVMSGRDGYTLEIDYDKIFIITDNEGYPEAVKQRENSKFGKQHRYAHPFVGSLMIRRISYEENFTYTSSFFLGFSINKLGWLGLTYRFLLDNGDGFAVDFKYFGFFSSGKTRPFVEVSYGIALQGANQRYELAKRLGLEVGLGVSFHVHKHYGLAFELGTSSMNLKYDTDNKLFIKAGLLFNKL